MSLVSVGDHVVASRALFGSCLYIVEEIMSRMGVNVTFVDGTNLDAWRGAVTPDTKIVFFETISNPTLEVIGEVVGRVAGGDQNSDDPAGK